LAVGNSGLGLTVGEVETLEIRFTSDPRWLRVLRAAVGQVGRVAGLAPREVNHLKLAVDEACANIIVHGYGAARGKPIIATLALHPDRLEVCLRDFGRKLAPESIRPKAPDPSRPGGLGVHLIHACMDEVTYESADGEGMVLRLVKYLRRGSEASSGSPCP
jgi:anti-sigma regulatory factor (Ser/Thr protein kinase)